MNSNKFITLLCAVFAIAGSVIAQPDCVNGKYAQRNKYPDVKVTSNVAFGSNKGVLFPTPQTLSMDIYEPEADTLPGRENRPLIIFAHGGSFIGGSRSECADLCEDFAKMGYVTATVDYRTGIFVPNERTTTLAVMRGMHDVKAAVRFFRKDADSNNTYGIDTNRIIIGGISAGAIAAIHAAYMDDQSEIPAYLTAGDTAGLGGVEGISGNPGYSSKVIAVINFSGAIGDTSWIDAGDAVLTSFHDIGDTVVPYDTREVEVQNIATGLIASGSGTMQTRVDHVGIPNELTTFPGAGHVNFLNADYDTVVNSVMAFLYDNATCKNPVGILNPAAQNNFGMQVLPNPSNGDVVVKFSETLPAQSEIQLYNTLGETVLHIKNLTTQETKLDLGQLNKGVYVLSAKTASGKPVATRKIVIQ